MGLFNRRESASSSSSRLPTSFCEELEEFAKWRWDVSATGTYSLDLGQMYAMAQGDRDGFLTDLRAIALEYGGWVALGAKYLMLEVLPVETDNSDFDAIALAAFNFLRDSGVPPNHLSPNDVTLWTRLGKGEPWLYSSPIPDSGDELSDVDQDESRLVARIARVDGYQNQLFVRRNESLKYVAVIEGPNSLEDPTLSTFEWFTCDHLHDLYLRVGDALQVPPLWALPELLSYIPLPPMKI